MLMEPEDEEPFITPAWSSALHIPVSQVSCCETTRPWVLHVDGSAPGHSRLKLELIGHEPDGSEWERTYIAEDGVDTYHVIREELPSTTFTYGGFLTQMEASPDGHYTPFLHGIAFEGDNRRLYLSAANLIGDNEVPENLELIKGATSGFSCLMLKHSMPAWFGFPSAMERVMQLCIAGELRPSWMPDNDELTDEEEGIDEEDDEDAVP
jgi:hypothetical protein